MNTQQFEQELIELVNKYSNDIPIDCLYYIVETIKLQLKITWNQKIYNNQLEEYNNINKHEEEKDE